MAVPCAQQTDRGSKSVEALLHQVAPGVARVVRAVVGGGAMDLDDLVQESLIALMKALPDFRNECGLQYYANRIAVRTALRARRRTRVREAKQLTLTQAPTDDPTVETPDDVMRSAQRHALLQRLLDELPEAQAETLALRVVLGFSLTETAAATGVPLNTVRSRVRLAREALRSRIEADKGLRELLEVDR